MLLLPASCFIDVDLWAPWGWGQVGLFINWMIRMEHLRSFDQNNLLFILVSLLESRTFRLVHVEDYFPTRTNVASMWHLSNLVLTQCFSFQKITRSRSNDDRNRQRRVFFLQCNNLEDHVAVNCSHCPDNNLPNNNCLSVVWKKGREGTPRRWSLFSKYETFSTSQFILQT